MEPLTLSLDPISIMLLVLYAFQLAKSPSESHIRRIIAEETNPSDELLAGLQKLLESRKP